MSAWIRTRELLNKTLNWMILSLNCTTIIYIVLNHTLGYELVTTWMQQITSSIITTFRRQYSYQGNCIVMSFSPFIKIFKDQAITFFCAHSVINLKVNNWRCQTSGARSFSFNSKQTQKGQPPVESNHPTFRTGQPSVLLLCAPHEEDVIGADGT